MRGVDPRVALRSENAMIKVRGTPQCRLHNGPDRTSPRAVFFFLAYSAGRAFVHAWAAMWRS